MNANGSKLGMLVVGCGFLGSQRAAAAVAARGTRLVAVHDLDGDLARSVASRHGVLAVPDYEDGLRLPGVRKVYMLKSYHQPCECFEVIFRKAGFDALPHELQAALDGFLGAAYAPLRIGTDFHGAIQEVAVYDTALTAEQIDAHYIANKPPDQGGTNGS